jgi:predicted nucleic-acid-binding Zn-ribbon protein
MPAQTNCPKCGGPAIIKYIQIPIAEVQADGTRILPSQWPKIIECPKCGTKEQSQANTRDSQK